MPPQPPMGLSARRYWHARPAQKLYVAFCLLRRAGCSKLRASRTGRPVRRIEFAVECRRMRGHRHSQESSARF
jgi:hypothetical protein